MMLSRVHSKVQDTMDRSELTAVIGKDNIYSRGLDAVVVHLQQDSQDTAVILEMAADVLGQTKEALDTAVRQDCVPKHPR
jgi:hypothetical protein